MLTAKLQIPLNCSSLVHRKKLWEKLCEGRKKRITLISAPAGFGKTTLLCDWISQNQIQTAWYALDKNDNDPVEFLNYLIAAVQTISKEFGKNITDLIQSSHRPGVKSITQLLSSELQTVKTEFILVLDDYHLISSKEINDIISFLLDFLPEHIHIVISTRSDPSIPLARLRSQDLLNEVRVSDLGFSEKEIHELLNRKLKLGLSNLDISSLGKKTEGWVAGLKLAALTLKSKEDISKYIKAIADNNRYIMDYLIEEVLNNQADEVREFLLCTSILNHFSGSLCDAVLERNNSQAILESLERENMFIIPLDNERRWYRYHHLFSDLLNQQLRLKSKNEIRELHRRASVWFETEKMMLPAIDHALEAKDYEKALDLLGNIIKELWENGQHATIMKFSRILPLEYIKMNPEFCLYYSWILTSSGQAKEAERILVTTEQFVAEQINSGKNDETTKLLLGKISVSFSNLYSNTGNVKQIFRYCEQAQKYLSEKEPLWYSWLWFSYGAAYMQTGKLEESIDAFNKAIKYGKRTGNLYLVSTLVIRLAYAELRRGYFKLAYQNCKELLQLISEGGYTEMVKNEWSYSGLFSTMGYVHFIWYELEEALENAKTAYELSHKGNNAILNFFTSLIYGWVLLLSGDPIKSDKIINELEKLTKEKAIPPHLLHLYLAWKIDNFISKEQYEYANQILESLELNTEKEINYVNETVNISFARYLIAQSRVEDAEIILSKLHKLTESGNRIERLIEIKNLYAILYKTIGNRDKALLYLTESLKLAENEKLVMFFIMEGKNIYDLIIELKSQQSFSKNKISDKFLKKIILSIEKRESRCKKPSSELLSKREIDVLKLIAKDHTNQKIADTLFISLNTVKTHVKNIHLKLNVYDRAAAVTKVKEMGII